MNEFIKQISDELLNGRDTTFEYTFNQIPYKVIVQKPDPDNGINIPSIIAIPMINMDTKQQIILESNNLEDGNLENILDQGFKTCKKLATITNDQPGVIVVPLIPSYRDAPYFQQLSRECFDLEEQDKNYRIDEQIVRIIEKVKKYVGIDQVEDKIFLNGYSASGVFAQRFALLHPELIGAACIGGASGTIPIPTEDFSYPIGIADYKQLTGYDFDMERYGEIDFKYFVGELETQNKVYTRFDDKGDPAPMHDMSYFDRSVPTIIGEMQRKFLGTDLFERAQKTIEILTDLGINIQHIIVPGRSHNNKSGHGVNEIGDMIAREAYDAYLSSRLINDRTI